MTFTIAVAGKGGVGKTSIAALAVRHLHERTGEVVLAVDADPNANLHSKLDVPPGRTMGDLREEIVSKGEGLPAGVSKPDYVDYNARLALAEGDGFDLLTMGRPEGPGCYCYVNNILRTFVDSLSDRYAFVVIDNEAGMEHLSRRTTRSSDLLAVVCDTSKAAFDSALRIVSLAREMDISLGRAVLVRNLADGEDLTVPEGFDAAYAVRRSARITSGNRETESLRQIPSTDPALRDVADMIERERAIRS